MAAGSGVSQSPRAVELFLEARDALPRQREPVTCGLPWPRGELFDPSHLQLEDDAGKFAPLQTRVLDRWSDGSIRWLLLDWLADVSGKATYRLCHNAPSETEAPSSPLQVRHENGSVLVSTGTAEFRFSQGAD